MESLSDTRWDVLISGTGLQQSLLALALSRSNKKVLHIDRNDYYGGPDAAFSLQEAEEWVEIVRNGSTTDPFSNASLWRAEEPNDTSEKSEKLSYSRAYTLSLSPQIIHSRSKLLSTLVSSKAYRQLEFVPVGNWWIYTSSVESELPSEAQAAGTLKRLPNGREDIFGDRTIDVRAKRKLMNFLKFVVDYENQEEIWRAHAQSSLPDFLSTQFQLPPALQVIFLALTLSVDLPSSTTVQYSLPRIARHITSIGVFGPGFGWVIPKWGGGSEIAQVACRAGAVGGGVYVLGTGIENVDETLATGLKMTLHNNEVIQTANYIHSQDLKATGAGTGVGMSRTIAIVSSSLTSLFTPTVEGAPTSAVAVVAVPPDSYLVNGEREQYPVYIMAHSSDTGECPVGQCVLYASTSTKSSPKARLDSAISAFLSSFTSTMETEPAATSPRLLYTIYYEQSRRSFEPDQSGATCTLPDPSVDLAFDETMLEYVEAAWRKVMGLDERNQSTETHVDSPFLVFESREQVGDGESDDDL